MTTTQTRRFRRTLATAAASLALTLAACGGAGAADPASSITATTAATAASSSSTAASTSAATIDATSAAIDTFLATLSEEQRAAVLLDYTDDTRTTAWSNFPLSFVERNGVALSELTDEQKEAAMAVLQTLLSDQGYETVTNIMGGDQYLADNSTSAEATLGDYKLAIYGDASSGDNYALTFSGHHLGLNADINTATDTISVAPTHLGSQPYSYTNAEGEEITTMGAFYDTAFAFYDSLTDEQKSALFQGEQVSNLVCAPGDTCDFPTGTGLKGSDLTEEQKQLLLKVIGNWVGLAGDATASANLAAIEATLDDTYVNWSGATTYDVSSGNGIYFQISGPDVYVEFSSQQGSAGADITGLSTSGWGHVHTIYRDPNNDYGGSVTQQAAAGMSGGPGGAMPGGDGAPPA